MSLRSRARALQKKTGLTYQQALQRVRAFGERSAKLRRETGWALDVGDRFLVDGRAPVPVIEADRIDAPIEVMEAHRSALITATLDEIGLVCESLRTMANARTVLLVDLRGCVIAHVDRGGYRIVPGTPLIQISYWRDALEKSRNLSSDSWELDDIVLVKQPVKTRTRSRYARIAAARAVLIVSFHRDESSLGLVRLRMAKAVKELASLLSDDETPTMPPFGSGGGPSGTPNEMRVAEPVPEERPKKKPTPIGRKRKNKR